MKIRKSTLYATITTTVMLLIFKMLGFIKQAVIAYYFGASASLDSYFVAYGFVEGLVDAIVKGIGVATLSVYTHVRVTEGRDSANRLMSGVLSTIIPFGLLIGGIICVFSGIISKVLAPTYEPQQHMQLMIMVSIMSGLFLFSSFNRIQCSILDSESHFTISRLDSLFQSVCIIVCVVTLSNIVGTYSLIIGYYIAYISYSVILTYNIRKFAKFTLVKAWKIPGVKQVLFLAIPLMFGNGMTQINEMVDKILATNLGEGNVSALSYCHVLAQFITNIAIVNIGNILLAKFSNYAAEGKNIEILITLNKTLKTLSYILIPTSLITIFCARDIVSIVYFRGNFSINDVEKTSIALIGYAISFAIVAIRDILTKSMYAFQNTKAPMINGGISIVLNIILSISLTRAIGLLGIPMGTSISALVTMFLNMRSLKKNLSNIQYIDLLKVFLFSVPALIIEGVLLFGIQRVAIGSLAKFVLSTFSGFISYYGILILIGNKEIKHLFLDTIKRCD